MAATQAVFTLVNAVLLRPLPFPGADRMVRIWLAEGGRRSPRLLVHTRASRAGGGDGLEASFVLAAGMLLLVAILATVLPARRAATVDPMVALRSE